MPECQIQRVLVGMGADAPTREGDLQVLAQELGARIAYLQLARPTLHDVLGELAADHHGAHVRLIAAPISGAPSPARSWLKRVAGDWVRQHPDTLTIEVAGRPVTGREAGLSSPAWADVPPYSRHALICRGPRCTALGAAQTAEAIDSQLRAEGLTNQEVLVTQTGCLYPCNHGPVIAETTEDRWWGPVTPEGAQKLVRDWAQNPRSHARRAVTPP